MKQTFSVCQISRIAYTSGFVNLAIINVNNRDDPNDNNLFFFLYLKLVQFIVMHT